MADTATQTKPAPKQPPPATPPASPGRVGQRVLYWRKEGPRLVPLPADLVRQEFNGPGLWYLNVSAPHGQLQWRQKVRYSETPLEGCWTLFDPES